MPTNEIIPPISLGFLALFKSNESSYKNKSSSFCSASFDQPP